METFKKFYSIAETDKYLIDLSLKFIKINDNIKTVENQEAIAQNIIFILFTEQGSFDFEPPDFGCSLSSLFFENYNHEQLFLFGEKIKKNLKKYLPLIEVKDIIFIPNKIEKSIDVEIYYSLKNSPGSYNKLIINTRKRLV